MTHHSGKKIVLATPLYPPEIGGPATYSKLLEDGLPERDIEVELVKFSDVRRWYWPKIIRHYIYYRRVLKAARNSDVVFALDPVSVGLPAMRAAKKAGKKFVVKIVGDYAWEQGVQRCGVKQNLDEFIKNTKRLPFFVRILQKIQTRVANSADLVIVPSQYLKDIVIQWKIPDERVVVINNSIKLPKYIPIQQKKDGVFLIVSAGRRVPWKGFEAIERLKQKHPNWDVKIISGRPRDEVLGWIKVADVFVLNSQYEGFPHVLVEAMTLETPVIVTNIRANETVAGEAALYIPPQDDIALEYALTDIEQNPGKAQERARIGKERMKLFELSFTLDLTAKFLQIICES